MGILLKKVLEEKISNEKYRVVLRQWKKLQLPKKSMLKYMDCFSVIKLLSSGSGRGQVQKKMFLLKFSHHWWKMASCFVEIRIHMVAFEDASLGLDFPPRLDLFTF